MYVKYQLSIKYLEVVSIVKKYIMCINNKI